MESSIAEFVPAKVIQRRNPCYSPGLRADVLILALRLPTEDPDTQGEISKTESWWMCLLRAFVPRFDAIPYPLPIPSHAEEVEYFARAGSQGAIYCPMGAPLLCSTSPAMTGKQFTQLCMS